MARIADTDWEFITGAEEADPVAAFRPLFSTGDFVYRKSDVLQGAGDNANIPYKAYQVLSVGYKTDASGVPLKQDGTTTITAEVTAQADAPWLYTIQQVTSALVNVGDPKTEVREDDLNNLADHKTLIGTEVGDWADPS